jgi:imidazolonepropionase-like amidohydrolase
MLNFIAALLLLVIPAAAQADTVVVTAARMLDVKTGRYVEEPVIVITDGRIATIVARNGGRPNIPAGARRIDLPGMTLLPGLIDMHVHLDQPLLSALPKSCNFPTCSAR